MPPPKNIARFKVFEKTQSQIPPFISENLAAEHSATITLRLESQKWCVPLGSSHRDIRCLPKVCMCTRCAPCIINLRTALCVCACLFLCVQKLIIFTRSEMVMFIQQLQHLCENQVRIFLNLFCKYFQCIQGSSGKVQVLNCLWTNRDKWLVTVAVKLKNTRTKEHYHSDSRPITLYCKNSPVILPIKCLYHFFMVFPYRFRLKQ